MRGVRALYNRTSCNEDLLHGKGTRYEGWLSIHARIYAIAHDRYGIPCWTLHAYIRMSLQGVMAPCIR